MKKGWALLVVLFALIVLGAIFLPGILLERQIGRLSDQVYVTPTEQAELPAIQKSMLPLGQRIELYGRSLMVEVSTESLQNVYGSDEDIRALFQSAAAELQRYGLVTEELCGSLQGDTDVTRSYFYALEPENLSGAFFCVAELRPMEDDAAATLVMDLESGKIILLDGLLWGRVLGLTWAKDPLAALELYAEYLGFTVPAAAWAPWDDSFIFCRMETGEIPLYYVCYAGGIRGTADIDTKSNHWLGCRMVSQAEAEQWTLDEIAQSIMDEKASVAGRDDE